MINKSSQLVIVSYILLILITESDQVAPHVALSLPWEPTESQPCKSGKYATIQTNNIICRHCSICQRGQQRSKACGTHSDTECEACPSGFFNDARGGKCKECGVCQPGTYVQHHCKSKRDTKCRPCPRHRYSIFQNAPFCEHCDRCKENEKNIAKCRKNKDTQCGDCLKGYFRETITGNCLPCSPCPLFDLRRNVIRECQTRLGIEHPDVCWPGVYDPSDYKDYQTSPSDELVESNVENMDIREEGSLMKESTIMIVILSSIITIAAMLLFAMFPCVVRMRRRYRGFPNTSDNGSFVFITPDQERHNTYINVMQSFTQNHLPSDKWITPETCTSHISGYSSQYSSDNQSYCDLEPSATDALSKSAPNVMNEGEEPGQKVVFTLDPDNITTNKEKKQRRKSKKRKHKTPPDVCYYTIPNNPQYYPQQMYVTL